MGLTGISKSTVSKLCKDIDERVREFLDRPIAGDWPYLWLDATYLKVRRAGGSSPSPPNRHGGRHRRTARDHRLVRRPLRGGDLLDRLPAQPEQPWAAGREAGDLRRAHRLKAAIARRFEATWQRCRVHWIRNALAHVPKGQHTVVAAAIRQAFNQPDRKTAVETWRYVADQLRARLPKLADLRTRARPTRRLHELPGPAPHRAAQHQPA